MFVNGFLIWYLPLVIKEKFGAGLLGLTFSIASMLSTTVGFLGGVLSDNIGRKPVIVLDSILTFFGIVLFVLGYTINSVLLLLSALALYGFARIGDAVIETVIYESVDEAFLGRALSIMFTIGAIAASAGSITLGYIVKQTVVLASMLLIISSLLYILISILLKETIVKKEKIDLAHKLKDTLRNLINGLKSIRGGILLPLIITIFMSLEVGSTLYLYPAFMKDIKRITENLIGIIYGVIPLLQTFIYPFAGVVVDKIGAKRTVTLTLFLQATAVTCFVLLEEPVYAGLALVTASGIGAIYNIAYRTLLIQRAPKDAKATGIAFINTVWDIIEILAPSIGALLWLLSPYLPFYFAITLLLSLGLITLAIK